MTEAENSITNRLLSASCNTGPGIELSGQMTRSGGDSGPRPRSTQSRELVEDVLRKFAIELLLARNVGLDRGDAEFRLRG